MKINKRECKKYANPGLTFKKNDGLLLVGTIQYIVRTAIKNIAGRRILIAYFYKRERAADNAAPEYTLFQCRDDYITLQRTDDTELKWRKASLDNLEGQNSYITKKCAFYRQEDEQTVTRFCADSKDKGFDALKKLQYKIMNLRLTDRIKRREQKIIERMKTVPSVPRGLKSWIHREILTHYVYYIYKRSKKPMQGYCTACRHDVLVSGVKHNNDGKCPRCGKAVKFKASGITKRIFDRETVQVLQKIKENEFLIRIFKVRNTIYNCREPHFSVWENARCFIRWDETGITNKEPYYYSHNKGLFTQWQKGSRPCPSRYQYNFECDICGYLYCNNLDKVLAGTPWQYSQIARFCRVDREPLEILPYLREYLKYPAIE